MSHPLKIPTRISGRSGQLRYICPFREDARCEFDTYSADLMLKHIDDGHKAQAQVTAMGGHLFDGEDSARAEAEQPENKEPGGEQQPDRGSEFFWAIPDQRSGP